MLATLVGTVVSSPFAFEVPELEGYIILAFLMHSELLGVGKIDILRS